MKHTKNRDNPNFALKAPKQNLNWPKQCYVFFLPGVNVNVSFSSVTSCDPGKKSGCADAVC